VPRPFPGFARRLLNWFDRQRRDLPWRRDRDPYRIWVSEVMLQQTTVAAVVPYFERFLAAFPTIAELAAAEEQSVLRLWEGLGYYRRARALHQAARIVVAEHDGIIPTDPDTFGRLPGVGRYTTHAVLSQAFDQPLPVIEANSRRVLCRLTAERDDPRRAAVQDRLWTLAGDLVPARRPGDFNQALMELGALVCTPNAPDCPSCPVRTHCAALRDGLQHEIPKRAPAEAITTVEAVAVVVQHDQRVLLVRRPEGGRWAGLWEFPHGERLAEEATSTAAARLAQELAGLEVVVGDEVARVNHSVTRYRIRVVCHEARWRAGSFVSAYYVEGRWCTLEELAALPVSVAQRALARALAEPVRQRSLF
jgi:A/G-specific adenine glycosylase